MVEPEMPFACTMPDCGMTFTNEDHLNVHTKKHDMVLQFGCEQKAAFVADQTPTPTRFIRNCEEVGLFQDLQNVNPFDEGFKRAIETKQGILSLDHGCGSSEELHTPQMFPLLDPGDCVFTTNNQRNITISRSSSDETGAVKEFETTRISKLTNEVTTISRIVEKHEDMPKHKETLKNSVSYTNNVIKIQSNVEIRKDTDIIEDVVIKDAVINKDVKNAYDILQLPIMSQKSIDFVVDSLTTDFVNEKNVKDCTNTKIDDRKETIGKADDNKPKKEVEVKENKDNYEVILKLPSGKQIKLINADQKAKNTKDLLKKAIKEKAEAQKNRSVNFHMLPTLTSGTLIPVTIVNTNLVSTNLATTGLNTTSTRLNNTLVKTNLVNTNLVNANLASNVAPTNLVNTRVNTSLVNATLVNANLVPNIAPTSLVNTISNPSIVNATLVNANLVPNIAPTSLVNTISNPSIVNATLVNTNLATTSLVNGAIVNTNYTPKLPLRVFDKRPVRRKFPDNINNNGSKKSKEDRISDLESRSAASKRYRKKLKETMEQQALENKQLKEINEKLIADKALLQTVILDHVKICPCPDALRDLKEKLKDLNLKTNS